MKFAYIYIYIYMCVCVWVCVRARVCVCVCVCVLVCGLACDDCHILRVNSRPYHKNYNTNILINNWLIPKPKG